MGSYSLLQGKSFRILYPKKAQFKTDLKVKKLNRKLLKQLEGKKKNQVFLLKILSKQQKPQLKPVRQTPCPFLKKYSFVFIILIFGWGESLLLQVAGGGNSSCSVRAPHRAGFSCFGAQILGYVGFSSCSSQAPECRFISCWHLGSAALRHVGSSRTGDCTSVPCIARWILKHWTTRKVHTLFLIPFHMAPFAAGFHLQLAEAMWQFPPMRLDVYQQLLGRLAFFW